MGQPAERSPVGVRERLRRAFSEFLAVPMCMIVGFLSIGAVPGMANCYAVLGFGGNGITYGRIGADIISGAVVGHPDPDADIYAFSRARVTR